jgi:imidazolonepropionase-like amidohydrolase
MARIRSGSIVLACFVAACASRSVAPRAPSEARVLALVHATVIPMDEERVLADHTVVVDDGTIVALGPASDVEVPEGALLVDATGRYLLPALCDMHVHLLGESWNGMLPPEEQLTREEIPFESFLLPYLASGVTTLQVLAATPEDLHVRGRIERGEMLGPRLILARLLDGPEKAWPPPLSVWVATAAQAREAVRRARAEGYDKIKVYSFLSKECYDAIVSEAAELGMEVMGHVPMALSVEYVLEQGQNAIAHSEELAKHSGRYDAEQVEHFAERMATSGAWLIPTLVTTRSFLDLFDDPAGVYVRPGAEHFRHPMQRGVWAFMVETLYLPIPADARADLRAAFHDFQRPLTKAVHEKGGKLLAGSDALMPGLVPGSALHGELRELVEVGLTPYEALRTSTTAPFEYLGESDDAGTIEVGKRSDLLLLDENPLADVAAASKVAGLSLRGRWLPAQEIQEKLHAAEAALGADPR